MAKVTTKLFIEVLQNGYPLCSYSQSLKKEKTVTLGTDVSATLTLPLYPLPARVNLLQATPAGVDIEVHNDWEGFVTANGEITELQNLQKSEHVFLRSGDFGTIFYGDLQILIRIGKDHKSHYRKEKRRHQGSVLSLFVHQNIELKGLFLGAIAAAFLLLPSLWIVMNLPSQRPTNLADLGEEYILSFMYPDHFETIPEAVQQNLNRRNYPGTTIAYYRSLAYMLLGWNIPHKNLLFEQSIKYFQKVRDEQANDLRKIELNQKDFEVGFLAKPEATLIDLPVVRSETLRQSTLRMFDKIDLHQDLLKDSLERRRQSVMSFAQERGLNTDYKEDAVLKANAERLKQISPFQMESNEANMYRIAELWARKTAIRRKTIVRNSSEKMPLMSAGHTSIAVPPTMNFASFLRKAAVLANEDRLDRTPSSLWGTAPSVKVAEPLIGEIDPKLIERTVAEYGRDLQRCYELALRRNKNTSGEMEWSWRIDRRGGVSQVQLVSSTISDNRMLNCVKGKMNSWQFPKPRRGSVEVRYPFRFSKTKG